MDSNDNDLTCPDGSVNADDDIVSGTVKDSPVAQHRDQYEAIFQRNPDYEQSVENNENLHHCIVKNEGSDGGGTEESAAGVAYQGTVNQISEDQHAVQYDPVRKVVSDMYHMCLGRLGDGCPYQEAIRPWEQEYPDDCEEDSIPPWIPPWERENPYESDDEIPPWDLI